PPTHSKIGCQAIPRDPEHSHCIHDGRPHSVVAIDRPGSHHSSTQPHYQASPDERNHSAWRFEISSGINAQLNGSKQRSPPIILVMPISFTENRPLGNDSPLSRLPNISIARSHKSHQHPMPAATADHVIKSPRPPIPTFCWFNLKLRKSRIPKLSS